MTDEPKVEPVKVEPEKMADEVVNRVEEYLGKTYPAQKIRNSQILSAMLGAVGIALFILGVDKLFGFLPGWVAAAIGLLLLALSGTLLKRL